MDINTDFIQLFQYEFVQNAVFSIIISSILCALLSYFIILRKEVFYTHTMSHIGFPGAIICVIMGWNLSLGLILFCGLGGILITILNKTRGKGKGKEDISVSLVLCFSLGLGSFLSNFTNKGGEKIESILFGNIFSISHFDIFLNLFTLLISIITIVVIYKPLLLSSISRDIASAKGVNNKLIDIIFIILLSLACSSSIQIVGSLLVFALMILPSAISSMVSPRPLKVISLAIIISLICSISGLIISLILNTAPSFTIVSVYTLCYLIFRFIKR